MNPIGFLRARGAFSSLVLTVTGLIAAGCGSDDGGGGGSPSSCSVAAPIECMSGGAVVGCCPATSTCSSDGTQCLSGAGGSSGSAGAAGSGGVAGSGTGGTGTGGAGTGGAGTGGAGTGGAGTGGAGTGGAGTGGAGTGGTGGGTCSDGNFEPNELQSQATPLGDVTDCENKKVNAKLDGTNSDIDWYKFDGKDKGCFVNPEASINIQARLCMFADCPGISLSCSTGTKTTSPGGTEGCCSSAGNVKLSIDCTGGTDDATVWMRVDKNAKNQCTDYSVDFTY